MEERKNIQKDKKNEMEASLLWRSLPFTDLNHQDDKHRRLISSLVPVTVAITLDRDSRGRDKSLCLTVPAYPGGRLVPSEQQCVMT